MTFRAKRDTDRVRAALAEVETLNTFVDIEELEEDYRNQQAGKVYEVSKEVCERTADAILDEARLHAENIRKSSDNSMIREMNKNMLRVIGGGK